MKIACFNRFARVMVNDSYLEVERFGVWCVYFPSRFKKKQGDWTELESNNISENGGTPKSSNLIGISIIYKSSILGYHYFWNHPYNNIIRPCPLNVRSAHFAFQLVEKRRSASWYKGSSIVKLIWRWFFSDCSWKKYYPNVIWSHSNLTVFSWSFIIISI